ncbi:alpha-(1,3)-fucosyltransferase C-like [Ruditapes philippinarum]|uniref:alpha-(1,3)-fucosyltransferase C-like n=1 Tax=Ruditapes philippinarum TaxID=129788 RepID=UPI00295B1368|nr:alpha-(1,3)-fucosyltransferase C-like [Ruditapes philippinarum]
MRRHSRYCCFYFILISFNFFLIRKFALEHNFGHNLMDVDLNQSTLIKKDITEQKLNRLYFEQNVFDVSTGDQHEVHSKKIIMFYNLPQYMNNFLKTDLLYKNCDYRNCMFTKDAKYVHSADALIFYIGIRNKRMGVKPPLTEQKRNPNQIWIFTSNEPPEHYYNTDYFLSSWKNTFNWSMLYRLDSDIPNPYGCLLLQTYESKRNYDLIFQSKDKNALWIVSHCHVSSERRLYVNNMIKYGFDVDIYGGCSSDGLKISKNELDLLIPRYKYFLAFENSICNDYISEKFFQNYNHSWIILVRGGADYHKLLPKETFINTADFLNVSSLVQYLIEVSNDREIYENYLRKKDRFISLRWPRNRNCEICRRLNNLNRFKKSYENVGQFLNLGQCRRAADLKFIK